MKNELRNFIFQELIFTPDLKGFGDDDDLLDAGLDSMAIMRLIMHIEEQYGITLPDHEIEPDNIHSLNALENWILRHQQQ